MNLKINLLLMVFAIMSSTLQAQTTDKEVEQGKKAAEEVDKYIGIYKHPSGKYINEIGQRLVKEISDNPYTYNFFVIDMPEPNAFALPGGYVYFSRGILLLANSEEELAGVMGHEIIHVSDHHSRKSQNKSAVAGVLLLPVALLGGVSPGSSIITAPLAVTGALIGSSFSRGQEKKADKLGVKLAADAGYNPNGLPSILKKIYDESLLESDEGEKRNFFSSHPYTPDRVEYVTKEIGKLDYSVTANITNSHKAFLERLAGMVIGANPTQGVFNDSTFLHPDMNFRFSFPAGWETMNSPQAVGIFDPNKDAQIVVSLASEDKTMQEQANAIRNKLNQQYHMLPVKNEAETINGNPAHTLVYKWDASQGPVVMNFIWIKLNGTTFNFVSLSLAKYELLLHDMTASLGTLSEKERNSIEQTVLTIVEAKAGETLEALSKRTGNVLEIPYLSLINDLKADEKIDAGRWIKIGIKEKYTSKK